MFSYSHLNTPLVQIMRVRLVSQIFCNRCSFDMATLVQTVKSISVALLTIEIKESVLMLL